MDVKAALIIVAFLSLLDITFTQKILAMYRKYNPKDENWADLEINRSARRIYKKYGLGNKSLIIQIIHAAVLMTTFFGLIYIFDFDLEFFAYAALGALTFVNISHYEHYKRLKKELYPYKENKEVR